MADYSKQITPKGTDVGAVGKTSRTRGPARADDKADDKLDT